MMVFTTLFHGQTWFSIKSTQSSAVIEICFAAIMIGSGSFHAVAIDLLHPLCTSAGRVTSNGTQPRAWAPATGRSLVEGRRARDGASCMSNKHGTKPRGRTSGAGRSLVKQRWGTGRSLVQDKRDHTRVASTLSHIRVAMVTAVLRLCVQTSVRHSSQGCQPHLLLAHTMHLRMLVCIYIYVYMYTRHTRRQGSDLLTYATSFQNVFIHAYTYAYTLN